MSGSSTVHWVVLTGALLLVAHQIYGDVRAWPAFKLLTDSAVRRSTMRAWAIDLIWRYGLAGLLALLLLGRMPDLLGLAPDLMLARDEWLGGLGVTPAVFGNFGVGVAVVLVAATVVLGAAPLLFSGKDKVDVRMIGDAAPLLPRNRRELGWGAALSFAAGIAEEIFFRMALPLALFAISGEFALSFVVAMIVFAAAHAYQGVAGALMALIAGALLTVVFLATGQIWIAIVLHIVMDLRGLVLTPIAIGAHRLD